MKEYVENIKEYVENMTEYVNNTKKYVENMKEYKDIRRYVGFGTPLSIWTLGLGKISRSTSM